MGFGSFFGGLAHNVTNVANTVVGDISQTASNVSREVTHIPSVVSHDAQNLIATAPVSVSHYVDQVQHAAENAERTMGQEMEDAKSALLQAGVSAAHVANITGENVIKNGENVLQGAANVLTEVHDNVENAARTVGHDISNVVNGVEDALIPTPSKFMPLIIGGAILAWLLFKGAGKAASGASRLAEKANQSAMNNIKSVTNASTRTAELLTAARK